jgi:hypothetical protein
MHCCSERRWAPTTPSTKGLSVPPTHSSEKKQVSASSDSLFCNKLCAERVNETTHVSPAHIICQHDDEVGLVAWATMGACHGAGTHQPQHGV